MKNKFLKAFLLSCALTLSFGVATGCGSLTEMIEEADEKDEDDKDEKDKEREERKKKREEKKEKEDEETNVEETEEESEEPVVEETEEESKEPVEETEEETEEPKDDSSTVVLSGDWTDMEFVLDGKTFKLPFDYKDLEAEGWSFDMADYGYEDGYVLNPGEKVYATIDLENPEYEDVTMYVGFKNISEEVMDITDCAIWSIEVDTCYGFEQVENYPEMTLSNGLTFGSTKSEVEAVCGPCEDIYDASEYGYVVYEYSIGDYYLEMNIYDEMGVTSFDLSTYE